MHSTNYSKPLAGTKPVANTRLKCVTRICDDFLSQDDYGLRKSFYNIRTTPRMHTTLFLLDLLLLAFFIPIEVPLFFIFTGVGRLLQGA